jgi:hypothetical protein
MLRKNYNILNTHIHIQNGDKYEKDRPNGMYRNSLLVKAFNQTQFEKNNNLVYI